MLTVAWVNRQMETRRTRPILAASEVPLMLAIQIQQRKVVIQLIALLDAPSAKHIQLSRASSLPSHFATRCCPNQTRLEITQQREGVQQAGVRAV
jgi:hypothetical protein